MPAPKPTKDEKPQIERFIEAAKQIGAPETDEGLTAAIRKIASAKPLGSHPRPSGKQSSS
jgi:hypothetical protein